MESRHINDRQAAKKDQVRISGVVTINPAIKPRHIDQLVQRWLEESLSSWTIKNRMSALRWWAEKIGKQNIIARDNASYGIPDRQYVTNRSKATVLVEEKLGLCVIAGIITSINYISLAS